MRDCGPCDVHQVADTIHLVFVVLKSSHNCCSGYLSLTIVDQAWSGFADGASVAIIRNPEQQVKYSRRGCVESACEERVVNYFLPSPHLYDTDGVLYHCLLRVVPAVISVFVRLKIQCGPYTMDAETHHLCTANRANSLDFVVDVGYVVDRR